MMIGKVLVRKVIKYFIIGEVFIDIVNEKIRKMKNVFKEFFIMSIKIYVFIGISFL